MQRTAQIIQTCLSIILSLVGSIGIGFSQPNNKMLPADAIPAPNAAAFGKYGDIPVSYFTGVPDISIPIHTLKEGSLSLPISLNYHAGGNKPVEMASWVGMGWSLNAGGMISRTVQGLPDELSGGYYNTGHLLSNNLSDNDPNQAAFFYDVNLGLKDSEPDIFSFNMAGYNGRFFIDSKNAPTQGKPKYSFYPKNDFKLEFDDNFSYFTIITPEGNRFIFGKATINNVVMTAYESSQAVSSPQFQPFYTSWYLLKMETYDGNFSISFEYDQEEYDYYSPTPCSFWAYASAYCGGVGCCLPNNPAGIESGTAQCANLPGPDPNHKAQIIRMIGRRLKKIQASLETVNFTPSNGNRLDIDFNNSTLPAKYLSAIEIQTGSTFCKKYSLTHDYFHDPSGTSNWYKHLRLTELKESSCDNTILSEPYVFTYNGNFIAFRLTKATDHWGFYNGVSANETLDVPIPSTSIQGGPSPATYTYGSANREPNETETKKGMLTEIKYPTGGKTTFTYESNVARANISSPNIKVNIKSCLLTLPQCCGNQEGNSSPVSFSSTELNDTKFWVRLDRVYSSACYGSQNVTVQVSAYNYPSGTSAGYTFAFNLSVGEDWDTTIWKNITDIITNPVANQQYTFKIKTTDGYGVLKIRSTVTNFVNRTVGGLRIKEIRSNDAVTSSNDVIRTYEYLDEVDPSKSSGVLLSLPRYAYTLDQRSLILFYNGNCQPEIPYIFVIFTAESIIPMSNLQGFHVGYRRVRENHNGNGYKIFNFFDTQIYSPIYSNNGFPAAPRIPVPYYGFGELKKDETFNSSNSLVASAQRFSQTENVVTSAYPIYKIATYPVNCSTGQCGSISHIAAKVTKYEIWNTPYRLDYVTSSTDGVTTTTDYSYDPMNKILAPTAMSITNSDGQVNKTEYRYPTTLAFACLRTELLNRNLIGQPTSTRQYVGTTLVSADSTRWSNWASGFPNATCNSTNLPYPWEFYRYEMTYDASGNATAGSWVRKGVMDERWSTTGLPKKITQTGWQPEFYEWGTGGILTKKTYNNDANTYKNFVTQYDYFTGTRLVSKITDVDGQYTEFTYDKLQRLSNKKARKVGATYNVQTDYTYQYKNATNPRSYVKSATTYTDMTSSGSAFKDKTTWQYMDGLGRLVQTVDQKHSPGQKDVISVMTYDNQGRQDTTYNVFESTLATGAFVTTIPGGTPYTLTEYYSDPLNRTWKVTPPSWYPTIYTYGTNLSTNVKLNHTTNTWYPANSLYQTTVEDPNGNRSFTFTDKKGRVILSRRRNNNGTLEANTYNLYDNKDRLTTVIPPDALITNTDLIFKYLYDAADNMTMKDVPDAAAMTMKYNTRNLMTLMQDGNLAAQTKWLGTNYDVYGRPYQSGFVAGASPSPLNPFTFSTADKLTETLYDDVATSQAIYKGKVKQSQVKVMDTANNSFITTNFTYDAHGRVSGTTANNFTGGSDNYAFTYDWADNRLTSTRTHKRLSADATTTILETTTYDHAGRVSNNKHQLNAGAEQTLSNLAYNYKDELIKKNLGKVACASFTGPSDCWLQSLDYAYNPQGWLTTINQASLGGGAVSLPQCPTVPTAPAPTVTGENDLFYLELKYDGQFTGMTGDTLQKNGNINQMMWRTRGRERQAYNFSYDYLDRLRSAVYADVNDAGTVSNNTRYNESLTYADNRGNISNLKRVGGQLSGSCWNFAQIDNLIYSYTAGTNKISSITDAASATYKAKGFNPGSGSSSYAYDVNGNMTTDPYKAMTVQYNHLNLPKLFTFTVGAQSNTIEIRYDAAGTKLRKTVKTGSTTNYTQDYLSGIEYRDGAREAIYTAEGRVKYTSPTTTRYEYTIKDHLGNARISFCDLDNNGVVNETNNPATNEVLQENHYYPFGLNTEGPWMNDAALDNRYQYNGKEWNDDFGLNWYNYGFRWYDPAIDRFPSVDPIIDQFPFVTPYNYAENEPVRHIDLWGLQKYDLGRNDMGLYLHSLTQKKRDELYDSPWGHMSRGGTMALLTLTGWGALLSGEVTTGTVATTILKEGAETAFEEVTGVPLGPSPSNLMEQGGKKAAKEGVESSIEKYGDKATNKLKPDPASKGDHSTYSRDNDGNIYKYETYEKTKSGHNNPVKRFDGGKPDGTSGTPHTNKKTGEKFPTPHTQGKSIPGGARKPTPDEIPNNKRFNNGN